MLYGLFAFGLAATAMQLSKVSHGALSDLKVSLSYVLPQMLIFAFFRWRNASSRQPAPGNL
jgi:hypothetical protein